MKRRPLNDETRKFLTSGGWLATQPPGIVDALFEFGELRETDAGQTLFDESDTEGSLHAIISGWQNIYISPQYSEPKLVHVMGPGNWGGAMPIIAKGTRRAAAINRTPCVTAHFKGSEVRKLAQQNGDMWAGLAYLSSLYVDFLLCTFAAQTERKPETKVCMTLLRLLGEGHAPNPGAFPDPVKFPIGQEDIAEMSLLSRNAAGAVLKQLERIGAIKLGYRQVTVLKRELIRAHCQPEARA